MAQSLQFCEVCEVRNRKGGVAAAVRNGAPTRVCVVNINGGAPFRGLALLARAAVVAVGFPAVVARVGRHAEGASAVSAMGAPALRGPHALFAGILPAAVTVLQRLPRGGFALRALHWRGVYGCARVFSLGARCANEFRRQNSGEGLFGVRAGYACPLDDSVGVGARRYNAELFYKPFLHFRAPIRASPVDDSINIPRAALGAGPL